MSDLEGLYILPLFLFKH